MAVTAVILSPVILACFMYLLCVHSKKKKKKNDYQMISGTQLCKLNIKDTAFFQTISQQTVIHPIASISHPFYPRILMVIQIWMFRCKRLAVIKCFSKRKLGNWVFLCVSADKNTRGSRNDIAKNKESPILLLMI